MTRFVADIGHALRNTRAAQLVGEVVSHVRHSSSGYLGGIDCTLAL